MPPRTRLRPFSPYLSFVVKQLVKSLAWSRPCAITPCLLKFLSPLWTLRERGAIAQVLSTFLLARAS